MLSCLQVTCLHSATKGAKKRLQRIPNDTFFKHKISQYLSYFILSLLRTALYASNCCTRYILHEAQVPLALKITPESRYVGILTKYYNLNPNSRPKSKNRHETTWTTYIFFAIVTTKIETNKHILFSFQVSGNPQLHPVCLALNIACK